MAFKDEYNFGDMENETERFVLQYLEEALNSDTTVCRCEDCVLDMAAYALNHAPVSYRISLLGKLYAKAKEIDEGYVKKIKKAVHEAVEKIKANPSHD
jgi:competence protein ComFB